MAVDDQRAVLDVLEDVLGNEGYVVHSVGDPVEALQVFQERWSRISLVLLDYRMPGMQGDAVFRQMQAIHPQVKALLVTSHCPEGIGEMLWSGLAGVILKPFHVDDLLQAVRRVIDGDSGRHMASGNVVPDSP